MGLLDWVDPARQKFIGLLSQMPISRVMRGDAGGLLSDMAAKARDDRASTAATYDQLRQGIVPPVQGSLEDQSAFWNPAGLLGKIVYHGSPHKFDRFDASKIGTGEGAQAYGHGQYLADLESVGRDYAWNLSQRLPDRIKLDGKVVSPNSMLSRSLEDISLLGKDTAISKLDDSIKFNDKYSPDTANLYRSIKDMVQGIDPKRVDVNRGFLYKADLPDEWIPKMLDWDKPLSQQSKEVQDAVRKAREAAGKTNEYWQPGKIVGGKLDYGMLGDSEQAAKLLRDAGIPGIRYLDGGSRNTSGRWIAKHPQGGENAFNTQPELDAFVKRNPEYRPIYPDQSYNYVVFPGLEDQVKILERNGVPINGLLGR